MTSPNRDGLVLTELCEDALFLCARVRELEGDLTDDSDAARQFYGHVIPALARMEASIREAREQAIP
jgi:hypothetical protein